MNFKKLTPEEAAALIENGEIIGTSGFTAAGSPKVIPIAIAEKAKAEHEEGRDFKISLYTGASTSEFCDGALAAAKAMYHRYPYQSTPTLRKAINNCEVEYADMHLSVMAQYVRYGYLPRPTTAIIEASAITDDGEITLTTAGGNSATYCDMCDRIFIELNTYHRPELAAMHDVYMPLDPPNRKPIDVLTPSTRIGATTLKVDPKKIVGYVDSHQPDHIGAFKASDPITDKIGDNVVKFLEKEYQEGRIPDGFLPMQSGVGNIANAVLAAIGRSTIIPPISMYTEVIQDSVISLMDQGRCKFASGCSLTVSDDMLASMYDNLDQYLDKVVLRPQEISNSPEVARRLGLICMNTAIEADVFGNVNSTHFYGTTVMNGLGGSGDFARSGALTIFTCPSSAKGGAISSIVPMVTHVDHPEHDVDIIATEQGVADLRGLSPRERAQCIIDNCVAPEYKQQLRDYLALTPVAHTSHCLKKAFAMHTAFAETGDMRNADFSSADA